MNNTFNVLDFGAVSDNKTDCTAAFQTALDKAGEVRGLVIVPPGEYLCNQLKMHPFTCIEGTSTYTYLSKEGSGGSRIKLHSANNECLLDITGAKGVRVKGLCLEGGNIGEGIHGVMLNKKQNNDGTGEDVPVIEYCRVTQFTGNCVHLHNVWVFTIRHSFLLFSKKNGLYFRGWDGFLLDNWFTGNAGAGIMTDDACSVTCTANRIEWNGYGIHISDGCSWNITGNYIDRCSQNGIFLGGGKRAVHHMTMTGNIFYRCGAGLSKDYSNAHVFFDYCMSIIFTSNTLKAGRDDFNDGVFKPNYGIVLRKLKNSIIANNTGQDGCLKEFIVDLGDHGENVKIADNFGSVFNEDLAAYDGWMKW
jgi:hypothetical protein